MNLISDQIKKAIDSVPQSENYLQTVEAMQAALTDDNLQVFAQKYLTLPAEMQRTIAEAVIDACWKLDRLERLVSVLRPLPLVVLKKRPAKKSSKKAAKK